MISEHEYASLRKLGTSEKTQNYSTPERILVWDLFAKYESTFVLAVGGKGYHLFGLVYNL